jgi:hypothetical protein
MATLREDLRLLQVPLATAALLLAIGGGTVAAMFKWTEHVKQENTQAQLALAEAAGRLARATEEEKEIRLNILQYRALAERGVIGEDEEQRLDLQERLNAIRIARKLFDFRVELSEQRKLDSTVSGPEIMVTKMALTMPLLHEEDLFNLLDDLRAAPRGYFQVKSCDITRSTAPVDRHLLAPALNAKCELDFFTIRERPDAKVAGS